MAHGVTESIRRAMVPVNREGRPFILGFAVVTVVLFVLWQPLGWIALALTIWCALFFRDPQRVTPLLPDLAVAPADGRVAAVGHAVPPAELGLGPAPRPHVSIFMSVFDVHVNRAPLAGRVVLSEHRPGRFLNAEDPAASRDNERLSLLMDTASGDVGVVQIAGLVARRIVPFVQVGDHLVAGERIGMIRFGSRVDVYLPEGSRPLVAVGQRAVAGETPIADIAGLRPAVDATRLG
jgi:phosphatidylserine decarboxylase